MLRNCIDEFINYGLQIKMYKTEKISTAKTKAEICLSLCLFYLWAYNYSSQGKK